MKSRREIHRARANPMGGSPGLHESCFLTLDEARVCFETFLDIERGKYGDNPEAFETWINMDNKDFPKFPAKQ